MDSNNNIPPPPQAGKFKPRKPAKVTHRVVVPENVPSSSSLPTQQPPRHAQRNSSSSSSAAGRGRGNGPRGSRRPTHTPIVQGQAFFTAPPAVPSGRGRLHNMAPPLTVASNAAAATATTIVQPPQQRPSRRKRDDQHDLTGDDEEIVGTLDEAVGYTLNVSSSSKQNLSDYHPQSAASDPTKKKADFERVLGKLASPTYHGPNGTIYDDSDSSDDENNQNHQIDDIIVGTSNLGVPRPLTLPFPHHHPASASVDTTTATTANDPDMVTTDQPPQCRQFPFWNTNDNAYCLVQLPTRLPPVIPRPDAVLSPAPEDAVPSDPEVRIVEPPVVTTPSIQSPQAFDHEVLLQAPPGRMGTLKIYRSGRTVLVLEPPNNDAKENHDTTTRGDPVILNVSEGLRCEFQQQAVSINLEQQTYTPFGRVYGTMVMTPDF